MSSSTITAIRGLALRKKIGFICSSGGHLTEALNTIEAFKGRDVFLIVHNFPSLREIQLDNIKRIYRLSIVLGYSSWIAVLLTAFVNLFQLIRIFWVEKPFLLFSTGAEIAIPAFYIGKIFFRTKLIFLESLARVNALSYTGKLLYPIVDLFLVQWPQLLEKAGRKAIYGGRLI